MARRRLPSSSEKPLLSESTMAFITTAAKRVRAWLPLLTVVVLVIGYALGYLYYFIYFGSFSLNIGDFFAVSDYLGIAIDHPFFVFFTLLSIPGIPVFLMILSVFVVSVVERLAFLKKPMPEKTAMRFIVLPLMMVAIILVFATPFLTAITDAHKVAEKKGALFDIYMSNTSEVIKDCGFIAATSRYYFCLDYSKKLPLIVSANSVSKLVMTKAPEIVCTPDTCIDYDEEAQPAKP